MSCHSERLHICSGLGYPGSKEAGASTSDAVRDTYGDASAGHDAVPTAPQTIRASDTPLGHTMLLGLFAARCIAAGTHVLMLAQCCNAS
jgi:hypothetical protein